MYSLKLTILVLTSLAVLSLAKDDTSKSRDKRQQVALYPRRGARPPPYAVQMEPIVQYSQRDPLYNPLASSKSDDLYEESPLNYYPTEPEPIIEIIIKESNESLPTPVPPPPPPTSKPAKEPIQVFYVKYEKKKGYGEKSRVVYDPPIPALTPVEEHEEIKPDPPAPYTEEEPVHTATPPPPEPSTTLRTIIRPDSEVYHSGSSGIRVTFGTDQLPPNNHNKRSDHESQHSLNSKAASSTPIKRQQGPYVPLQPVHPRAPVPPAFPQQRIVNSFQQQQPFNQPTQPQPPINYVQHQQSFPAPAQIRNQPQRSQQRPPITIQGLPEVQQRAPFAPSNFGPPHRVSINHPQQPGLPPAISVSHQNVHIHNQPQQLPHTHGHHFNPEGQPPQSHISHQPPQAHQPHQPPQTHQPHQPPQTHQPHQPPQTHQPHQPPHSHQPHQPPQHSQQSQLQQQPQLPPYKQQELDKQRYHEQRRQQELLKQRDHQRQHEQQRHQEHQRLVEQERLVEQQRQAEQQRKLEQQKLVEQQRRQEFQRQQEHHRLQEQQRVQEQQRLQEQQRAQEQQRVQEQQRLQEQRRRKQEQEQKILQEQQFRQQLQQHQQFKYSQPQPLGNLPQQIPLQPQNQKPGGEIFKAVPKLEQHYAIRENPLHPGPFPPSQLVQPSGFPESSFISPQPSSTIQETRQSNHNLPNPYIANEQQHFNTKQQIFQNQQQAFFAQNLQTSQQRVPSTTSQRQSIWGRPVFQAANPSSGHSFQKIYATPATNHDEYNVPSTSRPFYSSTTPSTTTSTTTTTEPPTTTTTISPKNEAKIRENIANLPDEVPDDIREQLLSSGILGNADIQILDYDKVGDIPIDKLPPEALANFYGAGGASAVAGAASEPVPAIARRPKPKGKGSPESSASLMAKKASSTSTKFEQATLRPGGVEMKVVRFDPNTEEGQAVAEQHIREDATRLKAVSVGGQDPSQYNRYLPLKVSGASFPIPDVPQLNGRRISSVVVLAPVDYNYQEEKEIAETRRGRKVTDVQAVRFLAGETLKQLVKKPTAENYKKWLEQESRTEPQRQSVVLLVTTPKDGAQGEKEIFMYDVSTQTVSKLSGDLSTAFVDAAESNSDSTDSIDEPSFSTY